MRSWTLICFGHLFSTSPSTEPSRLCLNLPVWRSSFLHKARSGFVYTQKKQLPFLKKPLYPEPHHHYAFCFPNRTPIRFPPLQFPHSYRNRQWRLLFPYWGGSVSRELSDGRVSLNLVLFSATLCKGHAIEKPVCDFPAFFTLHLPLPIYLYFSVIDYDACLFLILDLTGWGPMDQSVVDTISKFGVLKVELNDLELVLEQIDHPVLITECVCNPVQCRSKMAELLFETYGVPSIAFGVDVAFSYKYNQQEGVCAKDGLALCPGFSTTHVLPVDNVMKTILLFCTMYMLWLSNSCMPDLCFVDGEPVYKGCCRTNIGGSHMTDYLKELLSLKYPDHMDRFTWEKVEDLKMKNCYIAPDYISEARLFQKGAKEAEEKTRTLPFPPSIEPPSEEEIARKAVIKEKHPQRLTETAEAKRSSKINELENELHGLEFLLNQLEQVEESDVPSFLAETDYVSRQEIEAAYNQVTQSLEKEKGEPKNEQAETEKADLAVNEEQSPANIPDDVLTPEQDLDPTSEEDTSVPAEVPQFCPPTNEDFQIVLGVERFRCPELLFSPKWIEVNQAGLDEMVGVAMKRLPYKDESLEERMTSSILVTGGSSLFPGIIERLEARIRMIRPCGSPIKVVRALDPVFDAWRGAASFASIPQFHTQTFSKLDYYEKGRCRLRIVRRGHSSRLSREVEIEGVMNEIGGAGREG
ncbi:hypothetical protein VNO77_32256 [Canavalia gladiata]|uniref:Actin-related protein 5 n=1 Tax=Canavalia gladiata TaxID=3824 RepID=A0AAN9KRQ1_CANGL